MRTAFLTRPRCSVQQLVWYPADGEKHVFLEKISPAKNDLTSKRCNLAVGGHNTKPTIQVARVPRNPAKWGRNSWSRPIKFPHP